MNDDLSLFSAVENEDVEQQTINQKLQDSMSELIANRNSVIQKFAQETEAVLAEETTEEVSPAETVFKKEEIFQDVARYFGGDELAAGV